MNNIHGSVIVNGKNYNYTNGMVNGFPSNIATFKQRQDFQAAQVQARVDHQMKEVAEAARQRAAKRKAAKHH